MKNQDVLSMWCRGIKPRHFHGDERFSIKQDDYSIGGHIPTDPGATLHRKILFKPDYTNFGLVLRAQGTDSAVLGLMFLMVTLIVFKFKEDQEDIGS